MSPDWYRLRDSFVCGVIFASGAAFVLGTVWLIVITTAEGCT